MNGRNGYSPSISPLTDSPAPRDEDAEQRLLFCAAESAEAFELLNERVRAVDFFNDLHRTIWLAICNLRAQGVPVDAPTIGRELATRGKLDADAVVAIEAVLDSCYHAEHADVWARRVLDASKRRRLIYAANDLIRDAHNESVPIDHIRSAVDVLPKLIEDRGADPSLYFQPIDSTGLAQGDFKLDYLVPGLLVSGQPCILAGPKKSLKTSLIVDLALSLGTGAKFLGEFLVSTPVTTCVMSGESGLATLQETARRVAGSKGWGLDRVENVFWYDKLPNLGDEQQMIALRHMIERMGIKCLIVDPVYLAMPGIGGDAGNLFSVGAQLIPLTRLGQDTGCTIILAHHTKKGVADQFSAPELENIAWSGFQEWARQWILVGRRVAYDPEKGGDHYLWLSVGGSAGHSGAWAVDVTEGTRQDEGGRHWNVEVLKASAARAQAAEEREDTKLQRAEQKANATLEATCDKVLAAMKHYPNGETFTIIRDSISGRGPTVRPAILRLMEQGKIEPCVVQKTKGKYDGYRLSGN